MQHSNSIKRFDHLFKVNPNLDVEIQNGKIQMQDGIVRDSSPCLW